MAHDRESKDFNYDMEEYRKHYEESQSSDPNLAEHGRMWMERLRAKWGPDIGKYGGVEQWKPIITKTSLLNKEQTKLMEQLYKKLKNYKFKYDYRNRGDFQPAELELIDSLAQATGPGGFLHNILHGKAISPESVDEMFQKELKPAIREAYAGTGMYDSGERISEEIGGYAKLKFDAQLAAINAALGAVPATQGAQQAMRAPYQEDWNRFMQEQGLNMQSIQNSLNFLGIPMMAVSAFMPPQAPIEFQDEGGTNWGQIAGQVIGTTIGAFAGGPGGAVVGSQIGGRLGSEFDTYQGTSPTQNTFMGQPAPAGYKNTQYTGSKDIVNELTKRQKYKATPVGGYESRIP